MAARDRDTYVHRLGVTPETASVISSKNRIYAIPADTADGTAFQIGVVATFDPSETRAVEAVRGIGFGDHVAELVPGVTDPMTLAVTRTAQYLSMIYQVFGYKGGVDGIVRSLRHHKWPFDVVQELVLSRLVSDATVSPEVAANMSGANVESTSFASADGAATGTIVTSASTFRALLTYYEGCWMSDYSASYAADAALVQENVILNVTDIVSDSGSDYSDEYAGTLFNSGAISRIIGSPNADEGGAG